MSDRDDGTTFDGGANGITCEAFIRGIRQGALVQDRHKDDEWIASYAASRMDGAALMWFEDQSDEIQESWKMLRKALLQRWMTPRSPAGGDFEAPAPSAFMPAAAPASYIPTPAAAPPMTKSIEEEFALPVVEKAFPEAEYPPVADRPVQFNPTGAMPPTPMHLPVSSTDSRLQGPWTGRLQVLSRSGVFLGYVCKDLDRYGHHSTTHDVTVAMKVEFEPSKRLHEIRILTSGPGEHLLGVTWTANGLVQKTFLKKGDLGWGGLVSLTRDRRGKFVSSTMHLTDTESTSEIWNVLVDRTVVSAWEPGKRRRDLAMTVATNGGYLTFAESYDDYVKEAPANWQEGIIVFDPVA